MHEAGLFAPVDAGARAAEAIGPSITNFNEHYTDAVVHDQIELAAAAAMIAGQRYQAALVQECFGQLFEMAPASCW